MKSFHCSCLMALISQFSLPSPAHLADVFSFPDENFSFFFLGRTGILTVPHLMGSTPEGNLVRQRGAEGLGMF